MGSFLLAVALVVYNSAVNLWGPFHRWAYVPLNLTVAGAVIGLGFGPLNLTASQIGFAGEFPLDAAAGAALGIGLALPVFGAALHRRTRRFVADERVRDAGGRELAYRMLVRIPIGTAFLEEVAFRGVLYAAWRPDGVVPAAAISAIAFGLWHITPTLELIRANRPSAPPAITAAGVAAAVVVTAAAGVAFAALREACDGLGVPMGLHAAVNSATTGAAALAHRRTERAAARGTSGT